MLNWPLTLAQKTAWISPIYNRKTPKYPWSCRQRQGGCCPLPTAVAQNRRR